MQSTDGKTDGEEGNVQFVGQIYNKSLDGVANVCYLSTNTQMKQLAAGGSIKGLRAYFIVPQGASGIKLYIGDRPVGIHELNGETASEAANATVHDLSGRRVQGQPARGIYIQNGKKVAVK